MSIVSPRLKNRQAVRGELSQFVDDMVVTEQMVHTILEVPYAMGYLSYGNKLCHYLVKQVF